MNKSQPVVYGARLAGFTEYRYVGKTINLKRRVIQHRSTARQGRGYAFHGWLRKHEGDEIVFDVLYEAVDEEDALVAEGRIITELRQAGNRLLNLFDGGEGRVPSELTRQRMRDAQRGRVFSDEARKKMSNAAKGRWASEEERKAQALRPKLRGADHPQYGQPWTPEYREQALARAKWPAETILEMHARANAGDSPKALAEEFCTSPTMIWKIRTGKVWGWLTDPDGAINYNDSL